MSDTVYLVDTFSLMFQVFHAIRQPMTASNGLPTNAVFGFTRDLKHLIEEIRPSHLICALESTEPGLRKEIYADYKANRPPMPEDLQPQVPLIVELIEAFNVPVVNMPGWEADDVIATLTQQAVARGMQVRIVSSDKDHRQLLGPGVQMYLIRKNQFFDERSLQTEWGIRPEQVIDFQSLVGDSVDNVPGVPLVGPKKAGALLEKFETLEGVLANADAAPGKKLQSNLKEFADQALMSRELVTLKTDLAINLDWDAARLSEPDRPKLQELFQRLAFKRYSEEYRNPAGSTGGKTSRATPASAGKRGQSLFADEDAAVAAAENVKRDWHNIDNADAWQKFLKDLSQQQTFCLDLETTSLNAVQADIVGWAFSWQADTGYYVPVNGPGGQPHLDAEAVATALKPLLENPEIRIVNQNIKYDMLVLRRLGIQIANVGLDPMVGDYLLDAGARSHGLDALADKYLHRSLIPISDLIGKGKKQISMTAVDIAKVAEYASEDADIAWQLGEIITKKLQEQELDDLYWELERPLIPVLVEMEHQGIRVDPEELGRQSEEVTARLETLEKEIHEMAGRKFNIGSPKQLSEILFNELKLPVIKKTKTGASTDQEVLEELAVIHDLPAQIIEHRQLAKLKGTYLDALPLLINPETGNIHASFNQVVTATGRLSSSDPNLQNIPIRTEEGRKVRKAFTASKPDWKLLAADYSQIELRMLAHFSGDAALAAAFINGVDIHSAVAADIFSIDVDDVQSDQRRVAKGVNFGVIYGQSPFGLSNALRIPKDEAKDFIDRYFEKYAGVETWMEQVLTEVQNTGYAKTILGRRRRIEGIRRTTGRQRNLPERTAINTVVQGSAADLIKRAMIAIHNRLQTEQHPARMLLQIHDELVFETPTDEIESLSNLVREEMETAIALSVPLAVDIGHATTWLDCK